MGVKGVKTGSTVSFTLFLIDSTRGLTSIGSHRFCSFSFSTFTKGRNLSQIRVDSSRENELILVKHIGILIHLRSLKRLIGNVVFHNTFANREHLIDLLSYSNIQCSSFIMQLVNLLRYKRRGISSEYATKLPCTELFCTSPVLHSFPDWVQH